MDPNQEQNPAEPAQQFTPPTENPAEPPVVQPASPPPAQPTPPVEPLAPEVTPPAEVPSTTPPPDDPNVTPAYLKGADSAPPPGQSMYPPGTYQAAPGEVVQPSVAGGAVIKGAEDYQADQAGRESLPPQPVDQPTVVPPPNPNVAAPAPQVIQQPAMPVDQQNPAGKLSGIFKGLNKRVLVIIVSAVLLPLLIAGAYILISGGTKSGYDQDDNLRSDVAVIRTAIENYATDNKGNYPALEPAKMAELAKDYLPTDFLDPRTGADYVLVTAAPVEDEVQYSLGSKCAADNSLEITSKLKDFAIRVQLSDSIYCIDNK
jgi:hypothetical protein